MSELAFLSPHASAGPYRSPLARALAGAPADIGDVSTVGKIEVRGDVATLDAGEVVRITSRRALVLCAAGEVAHLLLELRGRFDCVLDVSAALAGVRVGRAGIMRRLTALDLDALPAAGPVAGIPAVVLRDGGGFRIFFPQEYADYVGEVVVDTAAGLA